MDDFNQMMESEEHPDLPYQTMTSESSTIENAETSAPNDNSNELRAENDGESVSANNDDTSINPTNETSEPPTQNDAENIVSESNEGVAASNDESKTEENPTEAVNDGEKNENDGDQERKDDNEEASNEQNDSSSQLKEMKREDEIDPNQCRICLSSSNLLDIFRIGEKTSFRICDLIMKLAPSVKISERDFLPHSICGVCVDRIEATHELRKQCEESDQLLRSKLKRSKKTTRRAPSEFLVVDCPVSSSESDDDQKSDDEFIITEESEESSDSDSDSSYDEKKKRAPNQRRRGPPPKRTNPVTYQPPPQPVKKPRNSGIVYIKAANDDGAKAKVNLVKQPIKTGPNNRLAFRCDVCNRCCSTAESLASHRRTHADEKCGICSMVFKQRTALLQHMQRHKEDPDRVCQKCHRVFVTKAECQRHVHVAHPETVACNKCKRYFPNKAQLDAHKCGPDRKPTDTNTKRKSDPSDPSASGRDLFKSVAPLTTTYWSDSYSD